MQNKEQRDSRIAGLIFWAGGLVVLQSGIPFSIMGAMGTESFWTKFFTLITMSVIVIVASLSSIMAGISMFFSASYISKNDFFITCAAAFVINSITGIISYIFIHWLDTHNESSSVIMSFWITAAGSFFISILCLRYGLNKRVSEIEERMGRINKYLNDLFIEIDNKELSYAGAFYKIKNEELEEYYTIYSTNQIIFRYEKLTNEEKEMDFEYFRREKSVLLKLYPFNQKYKKRKFR